MKYIVQVEIDPETGIEIEANPKTLQELLEKWQALNPIGMYAYMDRRALTVIVDVPNEDAMFEALLATWITTKSYPRISPVVSMEELPELMRRTGVGQ